MKRLLYLFIIGLMAVSCTDSNDDNTNIKIINLSVKEADWVRFPATGDFEYYSVSFDMPEITNWVYDNGVVNVYKIFGTSSQPLPTVIHMRNTQDQYWTETIDYRYESGKITLFVTCTDFDDIQPTDMSFKVSLIW